jgi:hypothetical protein
MLLSLALLAALHSSPAADSLAGTWKLSGDVMGNPVNTTCTITQTGATLGGSCTSDAGEKLALTGEIKDGKFTFKYDSDYQGTALTIVHAGTVASPTQLKGTIDVQPMGVSGTFTATPVTAAPAKP